MWSDRDGWIDAEVIWDGRGTIPGIGVIERREHYLTTAAQEFGAGRDCLPSNRSMVGKTTLTGLQIRQSLTTFKRLCTGCGEWIGKARQDSGYTRCHPCRNADRKRDFELAGGDADALPAERVKCKRKCRNMVSREDMRKGYVWCARCREITRVGRPKLPPTTEAA